ncbi:MAG: UDP-N-acetylmuramoyl-L-alanine--D-glutamate ligase [Candidatus Tectomicrobia bacterium]|nr:UDP-N-acetylmuramoyl-L-alanine--D-glutamate ligase [Candidatus Tectomicrobia bacterium]
MIDFKDKQIIVMGLGLFGGGLGATKFLVSRGAHVTVTDLKPAEGLNESLEALQNLPVTFALGGHGGVNFAEADMILVNPAVPKTSQYLKIAREHGVPLETEINLLFKLCPAMMIGVTGSNGKTTTTALIGEILKRHDPRTLVGGNIGGSLLDQVEELNPDVPVVLELSSFQLEDLQEIERSPHISVITNLTPNHLDRHGTMDNYIAAKKGIIKNQSLHDYAVLNTDDPIVRHWEGECQGNVLFFSLEHEVEQGLFLRDDEVISRWDGCEEVVFLRDQLGLPGQHNVANAMAAAAVAKILGVDHTIIREVFSSFKGVEHRLELVRELQGVRYYNDSIATTPESTIAALRSFQEGIVLIAGGYDKGSPFEELAFEIVRKVKGLVLLGKTAEKIGKLVEAERHQAGSSLPLKFCSSLEEAVRSAQEMAEVGDVVLLSPACASYDMFRNFQDRGRKFKKLVMEMNS